MAERLVSARAGSPELALGAAALQSEIAEGRMSKVADFRLADLDVEVRLGRDSLWVFIRREQAGGLALRAVYAPGAPMVVTKATAQGDRLRLKIKSSLGLHEVRLGGPNGDLALLRCTVTLTPSTDLLIPYLPRDLYPLDGSGDPAGAKGQIKAAQRGLNGGMLFFSLDKPAFGSVLYLQNLTALNDYFIATKTKPDGCVGGLWPEIGYQPPVSPNGPGPATAPLKAGKPVVMSDAILAFSPDLAPDEQASALMFLDLLSEIYPHLDRPEPLFRDWPTKAFQTLHDLKTSKKATIQHYGHTYIHPYTASEYPDSMVQLAVMTPLAEYVRWRGEEDTLVDRLKAGVPKFFDKNLEVIRRYLPNVGADKNADAVDSWYLYHPLANLGRLAKMGDQEARKLFLASMDFAVKSARHFKYQWPVQYDIETFAVITGDRKTGDPGQSDVGGLYAYVMLQALELTGEVHFQEEAERAVRALEGLRFSLEYQANITAWSVLACLQLYKLTGDAFFSRQSHVFLASFFQNNILWESQIEGAQHYSVFLGESCLHDGPYMALYECFESYWAFMDYVAMGGDALPRSIRLLLAEYTKYVLHRAWFYYPAELPEAVISKTVRNGHIDRDLAFPLEDLYAGGDPAGQVGQEIYGCGAAFVFSARAFHDLDGAPFLLFCDYPIYDLAVEAGEVRFAIRGVSALSCRIRLIPMDGKPVPPVKVAIRGGETTLAGRKTPDGGWQGSSFGDERIVIRWRQ